MDTIKLHQAIREINPNAEYSIAGEDLNDIKWLNGTAPISVSDIETKMSELSTLKELAEQKETLKASAKAKLIAGEPLTEDEANTIVL